jgi:nucleotide-binding universal stress UspA family protein
MVRNIIVPLDQSHVAECAIPYARALARRTGARITLLTAMEPSSSLPEPPPEEDLPPVEERPLTTTERRYSASMPIGFNPGAAEAMTEEELEEITDALKEKEDYLTYIGDSITEAPVDKRVVYGDPVEQIVKAGMDGGGDPASMPVLVMASHGRSGLGRILLGSVALKVAERATCPMLIVRALSGPIPSASEISLGKVLIALDGSRFSEAVLDPVRHLLGHEGTSIHLLRVVELDRSWVTGEPAKHDADGRTARDDAEQYLSTMSDRFTARGYATTWDVVEGDPAQRINEVSEEIHANLIALATHGYSGLKRLAIGSVAEEVLNKAKRPIILVRPEETHGATE